MSFWMIFKLDTLYSFSYNPITPKHKLKTWDAKPLIFALDINRKLILGINLHWIRKEHRQEFLDEVQNIVLKYKGKRNKIRLTYMLLKKPKFKYAIEGIRLYYIHRITKINAIPKTKWHLILDYKKYQPKIKSE